MLVEPLLKGLVIRHAAKQAHGGVAMSINEAGHQQLVAERNVFMCGKATCLGLWENAADAAVGNGQCVVFKQRTAFTHG